jgi:hypothetical protein
MQDNEKKAKALESVVMSQGIRIHNAYEAILRSKSAYAMEGTLGANGDMAPDEFAKMMEWKDKE